MDKKLFEEDNDDYYISFSSTGKLDFGAYSYYIDSWGNGTLNSEKTRLLFEAMKKFYEEEGKRDG